MSTHEQGRNSQNEVASNSDATDSSGGASSSKFCQLPHTPAPAAEVIDVDAEKKAVPVILPAPGYNSLMGDVYQMPAETIKAVHGFSVPAGFRREGTREALFMYSIGVYVETIGEILEDGALLIIQRVLYLLNSI